MIAHTLKGLLAVAMLIGLPLTGLLLSSADIAVYLEFPPITRYVDHAPFALWAFAAIAVVDLAMIWAIAVLFRYALAQSRSASREHRPSVNFPGWGWIGAAVMAAGWVLAWTRFPWFRPMQAHTFCIPWVGYILLVNALCTWRSGGSLLTDAPARFLLLWPVSALFWWFFEYLNRFVQNWYYVGVEDFSPPAYVFHASLAFATVLPAVLSTHRLLLTFGVFHSGLKSAVPVNSADNRRAAAIVLFLAGGGLALIGRYPDQLYPLVWAAPLLVITSLQTLWGDRTIFTDLKYGDWRAVVASATAALICGFLWELWNYHSLAHWEYAIPYVNRFHLFAMPLLGYGGYLPFGLECLLVGQPVLGWQRITP